MTNKIEQTTEPWTGPFWWTFEKATEIANQISARQDICGDPELYDFIKGQYITAIKGEPDDPSRPEECWALTNRYDPRVVKSKK